jgi:hypothetical protein
VPSNKPKVVAEKARSEKPFSISSTAINNPPKPKPISMPSHSRAIKSGYPELTAKPPVVQSPKNKMRMTQSDMV